MHLLAWLRHRQLPRPKRCPSWIAATAMIYLLAAAPNAWAHAGHDDEPSTIAVENVAPRVEAASEEFELVGIVRGDVLTIYLDHFATNVPIPDASIEVSTADVRGRAEQLDSGVYVLRAAWLLQPGTHDLTISITAGATSDLLIGSLEISASAVSALAAPSQWSLIRQSPMIWAIGFALFLSGAILGWMAAPRAGLAGKRLMQRRSESSAGPNTANVEIEPERRRRTVAGLFSLWLGSMSLAVTLPALAQSPSAPDLGHSFAAGPADTSRRLPDGSVFVPKPTQRLLGVRSVIGQRDATAATVSVVGQVIADPNSSGRVQAPQAGRIEPSDQGMPTLGQTVSAGQILVNIVPAITTAERGNIEQQLAEIVANIAIAEQRVNRLSQLVGSIPQRELDQARSELDGLRRRRAALMPALGARDPIRATASGTISMVNIVNGQMVDARETLFEIVDPSRLWIEALSFDAIMANDIRSASATATQGDDIRLEFVGRGLALRQQAIPLQFRIVQPRPDLTVGRPLTVIIQTARQIDGIALPQTSVVRAANGESMVWVHVSAERFVPLLVRVAPLDSTRVVVLAGLEPRQRVVTEGASLLSQIR